MNKQQLQHYRNAHAGETIIVCGCGASLNELHDPAAYITIGVNDVGRQFDPDYLVVLNNKHQFRNDRFKYVADSRAKTVFTQLNLGIRHPNIVKFRLGQRGGTDIAGLDSLPYTRNSPYVAVCLAAYMGAKHIGLIGVDFTEHHFFAKTGKHVLAGQINAIDKEYGELYAALAQQGIRLVNLSMQSRLTSLPKQNIADFTLDKPVTVAANPVTSDNGQKHSTRSCDMKIVIERYNPGIVGDFLDALAVTAKRLDYDVHRTVRSGRAPRGAISVVWNGRNFRSAGGPVLYCEHAWLPRWSYQISPGGINADSHIAPFVWDGNVLEPQAQQAVEQHLADIRAGGPTQYSYMQTDVAAAEGMPEAFILVPLQMEWDTNIQRHVPRRYRNMQNLITDISRANPDLPVIFKQHPADVRRGSQQLKLRLLRSGDAIWPHNRGNIHRLLRSGNCKGIISLNSNVVHDGMIWDVPSITLGNNIWTRDGLGPFLRSFPEDWSELYMAWQDPPRRACRDAYAWYLLQNQWTMDDVSDAEKVAALFAGLRVKEQQSIRQARPQAPVTHRAARNKPVESRVNRSVQTTRLRREARLAARTNRQTRNAHNAGPSAPVTDQTNVVRMASRRLPVINITARDMGWFFEDLKQHFLRASGKQAVIKVSERPRRDADAWIYLRTKEAVSTPVPEQTLVQVHDMFSEKLYQPGGDRYCVQGCGGVVLTHPAQRELLAGAGINLEQKQVLDRPIGALSAFTLRDATTDPFTVAWVGRPAVHFRQDIKRIDWFVQALHKLESGFRAVLLGERMETQHAAIRKAGLDCVYYTKNKFPISCYPNLYKSFDCVVITSRSEAGPICLFESLASGVPVVSTRAGWSPLLIKDGENGYLVDSIDEIADAVNKIRHNFTDWFARRETIRNSLGGYTLESWVEDNIRSALTLLEGKTGARPHYGQPARRQHVRS